MNATRRQLGDVDADQLMADTGWSKQAVRTWLATRVKAGELVTVLAYDPATRRSARVWRRATPGRASARV